MATRSAKSTTLDRTPGYNDVLRGEAIPAGFSAKERA